METLLLFSAVALAAAQFDFVVYNHTLLDYSKQMVNKGDPRFLPSYRALLEQADSALRTPATSVMNKTTTPPSGNKHDYLSLDEYYWPCTCDVPPGNCSGISFAWSDHKQSMEARRQAAASGKPTPPCNQSTGLPWIRHDGYLDPAVDLYDFPGLISTWNSSTLLALAYYFSNNETYAKGATDLLKSWFITRETKMNPNMNYAQMIPGVTDGQHSGTIDGSCHFPYILDAVSMLNTSTHWSGNDTRSMKDWFAEYSTWLLTSDPGRWELGNETNNHETWYIVAASAMALWSTGAEAVPTVTALLDRAQVTVVQGQIMADGSLPKELARNRSAFYTDFDLHSMFLLGSLSSLPALAYPTPLFTYVGPAPNRSSIRKALDFTVPFAVGNETWPWPETTPYSFSSLFDLYRRASGIWANASYEAWAEALPEDTSMDLAQLLWPKM